MTNLINEKLMEIEKKENCKILLAVESGSRAWGFASPDSDYDVRFIYVRPKEHYLKLEKVRDVIELPINDMLDINGWDINKTLRLLYKSNPTVFEWFSSPIIYKDSSFAEMFRCVMNRYFSQKSSLWHYVSMAKGNYREYLCNDMVKLKKYFYVLRPVLACKWILEKGTPPPMLFSTLMESQLEENLKDMVKELLELKINSPEVKMIKRIDILNEYLEQSIIDVKKQIGDISKENRRNIEELNNMFLSSLGA